MNNLLDLEKKINSELTTKINSSRINHDQLEIQINKDSLLDVVIFLKKNNSTKFRQLIDITAVDYIGSENLFKMVYLFLKIKLPQLNLLYRFQHTIDYVLFW